MKLSIIIPTKDRPEKLKNVIRKLELQSYKNFEVVIVNDGNGVLPIPKASFIIKSYSSFEGGVSVARNIGIKKSVGDVLIFIGDDTYPDKFFVEEHLKFHIKNTNERIAMLGLVKWYKSNNKFKAINQFLDTGIQFDFGSLKNGQITDIYHFYTANLSIKKKFIAFFDEEFKSACYEDVELGYRLTKNNLKLIYNSKAIVLHDHEYDERLLIKRAIMMGKMYRLLEKKIPGIHHGLSMGITKKLKFIFLYFLRVSKRYKLQYYHYLYIYKFIYSYNKNALSINCSLQ